MELKQLDEYSFCLVDENGIILRIGTIPKLNEYIRKLNRNKMRRKEN